MMSLKLLLTYFATTSVVARKVPDQPLTLEPENGGNLDNQSLSSFIESNASSKPKQTDGEDDDKEELSCTEHITSCSTPCMIGTAIVGAIAGYVIWTNNEDGKVSGKDAEEDSSEEDSDSDASEGTKSVKDDEKDSKKKKGKKGKGKKDDAEGSCSCGTIALVAGLAAVVLFVVNQLLSGNSSSPRFEQEDELA